MLSLYLQGLALLIFPSFLEFQASRIQLGFLTNLILFVSWSYCNHIRILAAFELYLGHRHIRAVFGPHLYPSHIWAVFSPHLYPSHICIVSGHISTEYRFRGIRGEGISSNLELYPLVWAELHWPKIKIGNIVVRSIVEVVESCVYCCGMLQLSF